jgi:hypothetical protein
MANHPGRRDRVGEYRNFAVQRLLIQSGFPGFRCTSRPGALECIGEITPGVHCATYRVRLQMKPGTPPKVTILRPRIEPSEGIHMYKDGSLCLYDYRVRPWDPVRDRVDETILPWTAEWLLYYELFLMTGRWMGPEAPHDHDVWRDNGDPG